MKKYLVKLVCCFIPFKSWRKKLRQHFIKINPVKYIGRSSINKNVIFEGQATVFPGVRIKADDFGSIKVGNNVIIGKNSIIATNKNHIYGGNPNNCKIIIGENTSIGPNNQFSGQGGIKIGKDVLFASNVILMTNNHGYKDITKPIRLQDNINKEISIGDDSWIGINVIILGGVSIGRHCVIGAGSVVSKDIPDFCIAAGNPAKIVKKYNFEKNEWVKYVKE